MRFQGLPPDLHVGSLDVTPVNPSQSLELSICMCCKRAGPYYTICCFNHTICSACSVPGHLSSTAWCPCCKRVVWVNPRSISIIQLYGLEVRCPCGLEATLPTIREHLLVEGCPHSDTLAERSNIPNASLLGGGHEGDRAERVRDQLGAKLVAEPSSDSVLNVAQIAEDLLEHAAQRVTPRTLENDRLTSVFDVTNIRQDVIVVSRLMPKLMEILDIINARTGMIEFRLDHDWATLTELFNKASRDVRKKIMDACKIVESRCASATTAHFWFDYDRLRKRLKHHESVYSEKQFKVIGGISFVTYIRIGTRNAKTYLGCFTGPTSEIESDVPWPLRRTIVIDVHNSDGAVVMSKSYDSYANGAYFNGFEHPKRCTGTGFHEYLEEGFLNENNCLVSGKLCISVKVKPLKESSMDQSRPSASPKRTESKRAFSRLSKNAVTGKR